MRLEQAVFKRKSIRKYDMNGLDMDTIKKVEKILEDKRGLYKNIEIDGYFVEDGLKVQGLFKNFISKYIKVKAPHYIIVTSKEEDGCLENVGYAFEEVILKLTAMGIGTCWIGAPFDRKMVQDFIPIKDDHKPFIIIALGEAEDFYTMYREKVSEFKREPLNKLVQGDIDEKLRGALEYVRVAPSGINSQPWRFIIEGDNIHVMCVKRKNKLTKAIYEKMNLVDIGIGLYHLKLGLENNGYTFIKEKKAHMDDKNNRYVISINFKN